MSPKELPSFGDKLGKFSYSKSSTSPFFAKSKQHSPPPTTHKVRLDHSKISKKKSKTRKTYVGPEAYAHLSPLKFRLQHGLVCVFVGYNPGIETAVQGHSYAHRSNLFWKLIYESGCVDRKVTFLDDEKLPDEYQYGFHDLVTRPTKGIDELSTDEMLEAVPRLEADLEPFRPRIICLVGKGIWEKIYKAKAGKSLKSVDFDWGVQYRPDGSTGRLPFTFAGGHSVIFVLPSTSGLAAEPPRAKKLEIWTSLAKEIAEMRKTL